jgi:hypothetical protein
VLLLYFLIVVSINDRDIDAIDGFAKNMFGLHTKSKGEVPECYCGDPYKMNMSEDYKTVWKQFWICDNLAYDPESGDTEIHMCKINNCVVQSHIKYLMICELC